MNVSRSHSATIRRICSLFPVVLLFLSSPLAGAQQPDLARKALDVLRKELKEGYFLKAMREYNLIESRGQFDIFGRHRIHEGLLQALRESKDPQLPRVVMSSLGGSGSLPSQILLLKALTGSRFPAPRDWRIQLLSRMALEKREGLTNWAVHLLADSRWPEAIDSLIQILGELEEKRDTEGVLYSMIRSDLYRVMGVKALGTAKIVKENWEEMGRKLPRSPSYQLKAGQVTTSFFGDQISPRSVFAIDISTSMLQRTSLRGAGRTTVAGKEGEPRGKPKVEIVKEELTRTVRGLPSWCRFNILAYNATIFPWRGGGAPGLYAASSFALNSAVEYTENLKVSAGTNIHDTMVAALRIPGVETVYLLSDGSPSRGGGPPQIEQRVAAMNYLKGCRIVTYGFTPDGKGSFDEAFMKRLAQNNWGWYRRLN